MVAMVMNEAVVKLVVSRCKHLARVVTGHSAKVSTPSPCLGHRRTQIANMHGLKMRYLGSSASFVVKVALVVVVVVVVFLWNW